jgi:hypothetical protein
MPGQSRTRSFDYQMTQDGIEQIPDGEREHTFKTNVSCPQEHPHHPATLD